MLDDVCIKIINLKHRADRRAECITEMKKLDLNEDQFSFFEAKHSPEYGGVGCAQSHAMALSDYLFRDERPYVLIMEDDFCLRDDAKPLPIFEKLKQFGPLWDVYLLAHNGALPIGGTTIENSFRVVNSQTTSGYLVNRNYVHNLIARFFYGAEMLRASAGLPQPLKTYTKGVFSCDMIWKSLQVDDRFWATLPPLAFQRPSFSDIEKVNVDYKV